MKVFMGKLLVFWIFTKSLLGKFTRFLEKVLVCDTRFFQRVTAKTSKKSKTSKKGKTSKKKPMKKVP